jgi:flagellar FliJ protein
MVGFRSLDLAIELAGVKRDQAMAQLQEMQRAHASAQDQMRQLQQYAQETDQRWMQGAQRSTTSELLHHQYQFMGRLTQAIGMQEGVLASTLRRVEVAKQGVVQSELRLASLKQVLAQRQAALGRQQARQEQKQMDEFAAQQTARKQRIQLENSQ